LLLVDKKQDENAKPQDENQENRAEITEENEAKHEKEGENEQIFANDIDGNYRRK